MLKENICLLTLSPALLKSFWFVVEHNRCRGDEVNIMWLFLGIQYFVASGWRWSKLNIDQSHTSITIRYTDHILSGRRLWVWSEHCQRGPESTSIIVSRVSGIVQVIESQY